MKLGIEKSFSDGFARWGDKQYEIMRSFGFECLDVGFSSTDSSSYTDDEASVVEKLHTEGELIRKSGLEISQVHGPWRFPPRDLEETDRAERMEKMKKCIRLCAAIGGKNMVIHPLMPFGLEDKNTPNEEKTWEINVEFMRDLSSYAEERGVTVCVENMPFKEFAISTPAEIMELVRRVNKENFRVCFDTGHAILFKELTLGDCVREFADKLEVLHVHDNDGRSDMHLPPFFGIGNWQDFMCALREIDFEGSVSLESLPPKSLSDKAFEQMSKAYALAVSDLLDM